MKYASLYIAFTILSYSDLTRADSTLPVDFITNDTDGTQRSAIKQALVDSITGRGWHVQWGQLEQAASTDSAFSQQIQQAKTLSTQFRETEAIGLLQEVEQKFRQQYGPALSVAPLIDSWLLRAQLAAEAGRESESHEYFRRTVTIAPTLQLSATQFTPKQRSQFERFRQQAHAQSIQVRIDSQPASLPVWIDGTYRGVAPQSVRISPGEHFVAVGYPGVSQGQSILVGANEPKSQSLTWDPTQGQQPWQRRKQAMMAAQVGTPAPWMILVSCALSDTVDLSPTCALLIDRSANQHNAPIYVTAPTTNALALQLSQILRDRLPNAHQTIPAYADVAAQPQPAEATTTKSIFKQWWFWTGVTAVVAGGVVAAVMLTRPDPKVTVYVER